RVKGKLVKVEASEQESVCAETLCEPNHVYTTSFGSSRPRRPKPKPVKPTPIPAERLDYAHRIIGTEQAWETTEGSSEIVVAVIDTGVDIEHPDLKESIWFNAAERFGLRGVDDDGNGYVDDVYGYDFFADRGDARDDNGHGTHCAGVIGARRNTIGIVGVAPQVRIMPLKFLGAAGFGDTLDAVRAVRYAVAMGANVISASWGGAGRSTYLEEAIADARAAGVSFVAAAGNESRDIDASPSFPAAYAGVVAVASTDAADRISSFSNTGDATVLVAAPGTLIRSTLPRSRWGELSGTSMATPHVAGAVALALSLDSTLTPDGVGELLCGTAVPKHLTRVRCGRLDVAALVEVVSAGL
ncbi:MAG: S8 family serine peptidase, partial [Bdellovibrionales bacterium]|nr:S8 family serine peptidase [Bdellovibrionales bacterium]